MSRLPFPPVGKIGRTALVSTVAGGSAGLLSELAAASKSTVEVVALTVIIVAPVITSYMPKIIESIAKLVDSLAKRRQMIIREKNTAQFVLSENEARHEIAKAGLEPEKTASAKEMLWALAVNPAVPKDQQRSDATYLELLKPSHRPRSVSRKPRPPKGESGPPKPKGGPPKNEEGGAVLPFQRSSDD
jgi:hypothetical protein